MTDTKMVNVSYSDFNMDVQLEQEFQEDKMLNLITRFYTLLSELDKSGIRVDALTNGDIDLLGRIVLVAEFTNLSFPNDAKEMLNLGVVLWKTKILEKIVSEFSESELQKLQSLFETVNQTLKDPSFGILGSDKSAAVQ